MLYNCVNCCHRKYCPSTGLGRPRKVCALFWGKDTGTAPPGLVRLVLVKK